MSALSNIFHGIRSDPYILKLTLAQFTAHVLLSLFIAFVPFDGPWKRTKVFSAKLVIGCAVLFYQTSKGFQNWWQDEYHAPFSELVQDEQDMFAGGIFLSQLVLGGLLYDIPAGILTGAVDNMMHAHHFGMFLVASVSMGWFNAAGVPQYHRYAPFFFGIIELSSIPLQIVDLFHPRKQPEWHRYHLNVQWLQQLNEVCRIAFAVLYIALRMIWFPLIMATMVWPDTLLKWNHPDNLNALYKTPMTVMMLFTVFFTGLQLYWGSLILKQIAKLVKGGDKDKKGEAGGKAKARIKSV